jgi:hypothetical protein
MWILPERSQYETDEAHQEACKRLGAVFKEAGWSNTGVTIGRVRRCPKCGESLGFSDWCNACEVRRAFGAVRCSVCGTGHASDRPCPKCMTVGSVVTPVLDDSATKPEPAVTPGYCARCGVYKGMDDGCPCSGKAPQAGSPIPGIALVPKPEPVAVHVGPPPGFTYLPDPARGWECPKCGRTFAPFVPHCDVCHQYPLRTFQPAGSSPPFAPPWETIKVVCDAGTQITAT